MKLLRTMIMIGGVILLASCATPPEVLQGNVVNFDEAKLTITVQDELDPDNVCEISYEGADMGTRPQPGDTVRIAYEDHNGRFVATRVMKISRQ